ncbi:MAG: HupE/UreJ family protein [Gammaproteobacteria bacterium]|uniref:HupE/UreJ family protein n=1 Tax=Candidatus Thiopontia autotrophica TaxID=2841688 RepID=A0A8J6TSV2_9GAMM|nr:HupE/UreJ family protein [Candidatus Thiopontia autotrophica]
MIALLSPTAVVEAHPGLDHVGGVLDGVIHLLSSADHLLLLLAVVGVGALLLSRKILPPTIKK